jgi:hypothetical protein
VWGQLTASLETLQCIVASPFFSQFHEDCLGFARAELLEGVRVFEAFALLRVVGNLLAFEECLSTLIVSHVP